MVIDALVAEKVMGHWLTSDRLFANHAPIPAYSSEIAAAWLVWAKIGTLSADKRVMFFSALRAHVGTRLGEGSDMDAVLNMQPIDICNAALEVHGVRTLPDWYYDD